MSLALGTGFPALVRLQRGTCSPAIDCWAAGEQFLGLGGPAVVSQRCQTWVHRLGWGSHKVPRGWREQAGTGVADKIIAPGIEDAVAVRSLQGCIPSQNRVN